jgi:hypothetical protein
MRGRPTGEERPHRNRDRHTFGEPYFKADWGNTGTLSQERQEEEARTGSERLLAAIRKHFAKWESENGFRAGAAQILIPAGYDPEQRVAA